MRSAERKAETDGVEEESRLLDGDANEASPRASGRIRISMKRVVDAEGYWDATNTRRSESSHRWRARLLFFCAGRGGVTGVRLSSRTQDLLSLVASGFLVVSTRLLAAVPPFDMEGFDLRDGRLHSDMDDETGTTSLARGVNRGGKWIWNID